MCCSVDRQMNVVAVQMLLWGWEGVLDSLVQCCYPCAHPASSVPELWVQLWWESRGWSGHRPSAGVCWHSSSVSVLLCWFTPGGGLVPGVYRESCKENLCFIYVASAFLYCHPLPTIPPLLVSSSTLLCAPLDLSYWKQNVFPVAFFKSNDLWDFILIFWGWKRQIGTCYFSYFWMRMKPFEIIGFGSFSFPFQVFTAIFKPGEHQCWKGCTHPDRLYGGAS